VSLGQPDSSNDVQFLAYQVVAQKVEGLKEESRR
jgi:hypothetical protein